MPLPPVSPLRRPHKWCNDNLSNSEEHFSQGIPSFIPLTIAVCEKSRIPNYYHMLKGPNSIQVNGAIGNRLVMNPCVGQIWERWSGPWKQLISLSLILEYRTFPIPRYVSYSSGVCDNFSTHHILSLSLLSSVSQSVKPREGTRYSSQNTSCNPTYSSIS